MLEEVVKKWRYTLTANVLGRSVDDDAIAICGPPGCLVSSHNG
jgi:hypothetical protein